MTTPTLSIILPTQGRPTLERALASARDQLGPGDECWVVVDTHEMTVPAFAAIAARVGEFGPQFRVTGKDAGRHSYGHDQINHGMACATGDYLSFQDDDDIFLPGALAHMREAATAHPGRPLLFRFVSFWGGIYWVRPGLVRQAAIGGHCLVVPNEPARLGEWGAHYEGDFSMIVQTLELWKPVEPVWCLPLISRQRPQEAA